MTINNCIIGPDESLIELHKLLNMTNTFSSISGKKHILGIIVASFLEPRNKEGILVHAHGCVHACMYAHPPGVSGKVDGDRNR